MNAVRRVRDWASVTFVGSSTVVNAYIMAQTVKLILEAQDEAAAYHAQNMANSAFGADDFSSASSVASAFLSQSDIDYNGNEDPYPLDPFPRSFWYTFFLISPSVALICYRAIDFSLDSLLGCILWPQLLVLRAVKEKGYHLSRNHREFFTPLILSIFIYWYNMIQIVRVYRRLINGEEEQQRLRFRTIRRGEIHPMRSDLKNFNAFQLRNLENELKYLYSEHTHPRPLEAISKRLLEVQEAIRRRPSGGWSGPPSRTSECVVCWSSPPTKEFVPCGHTVLCEDCGSTWRQHEQRNFPFGQPLCPQCRVTVMRENYARTYPIPLISQEEYMRQGSEFTSRELGRLYEHVRQNPGTRSRLRHCQATAFDTREKFNSWAAPHLTSTR